ncbi:MAG: hypothetical protein COA84_14230 [Robiginitomaculum sp.]|nr:MAG: hypothetical protein COA84_14230 [Robiginitomaculum sp.]
MMEVRAAIPTIFREAVLLSGDQLTSIFTKFDSTQLEHFKTSINSAQNKNADIEQVRDMMKTLGISMGDISTEIIVDSTPQIDTLSAHIAKTKTTRATRRIYAPAKSMSDKFELGEKAVKMAANGKKSREIQALLNLSSATFHYVKVFFKAASKLNNTRGVDLKKIEVGKGVTFENVIKLIDAVNSNSLRKLNCNDEYRVAEFRAFRAVLVETAGLPAKLKLMTHESYNKFITQ